MELAVGFDVRGTWISARYGALGIHKHTVRRPLETTVSLQCEADDVAVIVRSSAVIVTRRGRAARIEPGETPAGAAALLTDSCAVRRARSAVKALEPSVDSERPEASLRAALVFVSALLVERDALAIAGARAAFLDIESRWMDSTDGIHPSADAVRVRSAARAMRRQPVAPRTGDVSDWIARFAQSDRDAETAPGHGWVGSLAVRGAA